MKHWHSSAQEAIQYYEKARDIFKGINNITGVTLVENYIVNAKAKYEGKNKEIKKEELKQCQKMYELAVKTFGQDTPDTIRKGVNLSIALREAHRGIEAERLLIKLAATSKQVHGLDHKTTKLAVTYRQKCKDRRVKVEGKSNWFQAIRYEEGGEKLVVQGPIAEPRNVEEEEMLTIAPPDDIFGLAQGTPVICTGLKLQTHLNGKIGDVRSRGEETDCYLVYFEDEELDPQPVKAKFLRILFELPEKE